MMKRIRSLIAGFLAALALGSLVVPASAAAAHDRAYQPAESPRDAQGEARKEMREGKALSLREIERLILPKMKGSEYLGPAYDASAHAYRLKFIRDGRVTYVDVDARTGRIIKRSR
ncbi:MAG: PepSY domain-containing protein [Pseudomonadota bacterium]